MTGHSGIVPTDSGIVTSDSGQALKLGTIDRNGWARWTGMAGHDGPESVGTMDRNTQLTKLNIGFSMTGSAIVMVLFNVSTNVKNDAKYRIISFYF